MQRQRGELVPAARSAPVTFLAIAAVLAFQGVASAQVPGKTPTLTATADGKTEIDLTWGTPSNTGPTIDGYKIEVSTDGGSNYNDLEGGDTGNANTSYSHTGLSPGTTYRYLVSALNNDGAGAPSDYAEATTDADVPDQTPTLTAIADGKTEIDLTWGTPANNGSAINGYKIEVSTDGGSNYNDLEGGNTGNANTTYTHIDLSPGTTYRYRVSAINGIGTGTASAHIEATTDADVPDQTPTLTAIADGKTEIDLTWGTPANNGSAINGYKIEVSTDGGSNYNDLEGGNTGNANTTYTHIDLSPGTTYRYRVSAINGIGTGTASAHIEATTSPPTPPGAPTNLRSKPGDGQVTLRWNVPTDTGGELITHYEYEQNGDGIWHTTGGTETSFTVSGLTNGEKYTFRVRAVNLVGESAASEVVSTTPSDPPTAPDAPKNLLADVKDGAVTLSWDAPFRNGGATITDYEYQIDGEGEWISIGSTNRIHTITGLTNGTVYVFRVRAVNRIGSGRASNRAVATPGAVLDFAHFANGAGIISDLVFVNVSPHPTRPALYFSDQGGDLIDSASVVDLTGDLVVAEDGSLTVHTEMESLGQLTISTHGRGELVSGSVRVVSSVPIGGLVRYSVPGVGVAAVGASPPVRDVLFPVRRQEGGIRTAAALHNLQEEVVGVNCRLMSGGVALEEVEIPLEANGQASWFIEEAFPTTYTSDFLGSVRCTVPGNGRFTAIAVEMDAAKSIFTTLPVVPVDRTGGSDGETVLDFAHFANGTWITDLVFMNLSIQPSGPPPSPFHTAIHPSRPVIYFYDTEGALVAPESVVDVTGDLEITEDGALTVQTEMEPLGVLTISTHGRGELVSGSVRVVSDGPIGGMLRFEHPALGVAGVGASPPVSDALFPVRRQEGGITTGVALHNLESSPGLLRCDLMREGVLLDAASIPLEANGQTAWLIDQAFPGADTSDFAGSVRCDAVGEGMFSAVALEMDPGNRIFTTLPVVPVPEMPSQE